MRRLVRYVTACFLCIGILMFSTLSASAEGVSSTDGSVVQTIVSDILLEQLSLSRPDDVQTAIRDILPTMGTTSVWYAMALSQLGSYEFSDYEAWLLEKSEATSATGAVARQKYALTLAAIGSTSPYIRTALTDTVGKGGIMSLVFGLHLLNNGYECTEITVSDVCDMLVERACANGGWSLSGDAADVDVTAMVLCALAPFCKTDADVQDSVEKALLFLSSVQQANGDFSSYGVTNAESTSQVLLALSSLGIDALSDARFVKNGKTLVDALLLYKTDSGCFAHERGGEVSAMATAQVLYACVGYLRMQSGQSPFFVFDGCDAANAEPPLVSTDAPLTDGMSSSWLSDYRIWVTVVMLVLGVAVGLLLFFTGRRSSRHYISLALIVGILIGVVCLTDIRSPQDYYTAPTPKEDAIGTVTVTVRYDAVAGEMSHLREDGILIPQMTLSIAEGDTVYDLLSEATRACGVPLYTSGNGVYTYVRGIGSLYEYDFGDLSGWIFYVNGVSPSVGCNAYELSDRDVVEWHYTLSFGKDIDVYYK